MTNRLTLPALAFALCSTALFAGGIARAEDAMKPADAMATDAMKPATDAMKPVDPMAAEKMKNCMDKAAMETDAMKKDAATKTCNEMGTAK
ncbi:MAG: pentapeptide MXKDX repeat protein [Mesorhizobium sp.]|nr:MAG: pentapeptide MXKDX repeat protein [Mesorhizobium sp.]